MFEEFERTLKTLSAQAAELLGITDPKKQAKLDLYLAFTLQAGVTRYAGWPPDKQEAFSSFLRQYQLDCQEKAAK